MKIILSIAFIVISISTLAQKKYLMLVGTYTSTGSDGIYVERFNTKNGKSKRISSVKTSNPSFLTVSADNKFVYAVNENANAAGDGGGVTSFSLNRKKGQLTAIDSTSSKGNHPCYISLSDDNRWVAIGNYSSGNFAIIPASTNGALGTPNITIQHSGKGPDKRQSSPHVHSTVFSPDGKHLFVNDLGIDKILVYDFDAQKGLVKLVSETKVEPGNGPRHLAFDPDNKFVYILNELKGRINVFKYNTDSTGLTWLQTIITTESNFKGFAGSADIHISADGNFLYASNRGDANNIAIYKVDKVNGELTLIGHQPVLGKAPRNFSIDPSGKFLLCANQDSNEIVVFKRNKKTGLLTDTGKRISIPKPVCIKWVKAKK